MAYSVLTDSELREMGNKISIGMSAERTVLRFHKWLITTMNQENQDFPSVDDDAPQEELFKEFLNKYHALLRILLYIKPMEQMKVF